MSLNNAPASAEGFTPDLSAGRDGLPRLWGRPGFWQVRLRWAVAPLILLAVVAGRLLGFEFATGPILVIALASPVYNGILALVFSRYRDRRKSDLRLDRLLTNTEVVADYAAMFLLIHYTGGVSSPLIIFLIFHVIIAAIEFTAATAYALAGAAAGGLWILFLGQTGGWLRCHSISYHGVPIILVEQPVQVVLVLSAYTAALFVTAALVSRIVNRLRARVGDLAEATSSVARANDKFQSLYRMLSAIGAQRRMQPVLEVVTEELCRVTDVHAVAVKLLSDDGKELRYVAAHGLPPSLTSERVVYLDQSPLNRRVIEDQVLVESTFDQSDVMQLQREFRAMGIRSAVLAPLKVEDRVIGTLGFYDLLPDRFDERNRDFLRLAAELVAIAIDHARAYEAVETLMRDRTEFMLEVAHNLRAPIGASLSIVDLLTQGYLGELAAPQTDHLLRLEGRLRALDRTIGELLAIARTRDLSREIEDVSVDFEALAGYTQEAFQGEAKAKGLALEVVVAEKLPPLPSGVGLLERLMDNLVSNAIKYTPEGGSVQVRFARQGPDAIRIEVVDTGIGIPAGEQGKLFREFFRASNARKFTRLGTGLGLVLVKQTVERHGGTLDLQSEEGRGTKITITLPLERDAASSKERPRAADSE